jgi:uncharacterized protein
VSQLQPISIQELSRVAEGLHWELAEHLAGLESLTPVRGRVQAIHRSDLLEVDGEAHTIVTLRCDRCLQHFNHPLSFSTRELLWLGEEARQQGLQPEAVEQGALESHGSTIDLDPDHLTESLDPNGCFDPAHWTFEQLSLQLPVVNRCGPDCPGPARWSSDHQPTDPRWAALQQLQQP